MEEEQSDAREIREKADRENAQKKGMQSGRRQAAESLFDLVDDCDRALQVLDSDPAAMREGVEQMRLRAIQRFADLGFEPFAAVGDDFDPYLHQAIALVPGGEDGKIAEVHQRGWRDREGMVRSAMVSVWEGRE